MRLRFLPAVLRFLVATIPGLPLIAADSAKPPYPGRLGVEASGDAFVDIVKENYRWVKDDGKGGWVDLARGDVDGHGWPRTDCRWINDMRPCAEWAGSIDDPDGFTPDTTGTYHGSFKGQARLSVVEGPCSIAGQSYDPATNTTRFELSIRTRGKLVILGFSNTRRTAEAGEKTGISGFQLIRPGYPADTDRLFTNEYLKCLRSAAFSTIRFMGNLCTNGNVEWGKDHTLLQKWSHRKLPGDASVQSIPQLNKKDGWPWEYAIELCNRSGMNLWINVPASADDDYIRQLAVLVKERLDPSLAVYLEHSNEVWNFGFLQYAWNKARAREEVREAGAGYDFDHCGSEEIWGQRRHADRVRAIVRIFGGVFGMNEINRRIRGVLAGVTAEPEGFFVCGRLHGMLEYLEKQYGNPGRDIYAISIPVYYGGPAAAGEESAAKASTDDILASMQATIEKDKVPRQAVIDLARRFSLPGGVCAYEGGPDIGGGRAANVANRIRAIRDPRQRAIYRRNFAGAFWDLGGNLAMQFTLSGPYTRYGAWGLTDDVANPDRNSLFEAARDLVGPGRGGGGD